MNAELVGMIGCAFTVARSHSEMTVCHERTVKVLCPALRSNEATLFLAAFLDTSERTWKDHGRARRGKTSCNFERTSQID